jgi:hypothetical protein
VKTLLHSASNDSANSVISLPASVIVDFSSSFRESHSKLPALARILGRKPLEPSALVVDGEVCGC